MKAELNFKSIIDLIFHFNTEEKCIEYLENLRWTDGVRCCYCRSANPCKFSDGKTYKCSHKLCRKKFSVKTNSIFSNSNIPLQKWIAGMYLFSSHKKGISSIQMGKDLGLTQKTAWTMLHKIRTVFGEELKEQLSGKVEVDETFVGGKNKNRHKDKKVKNSQGRSFKDKTPILGIMQRSENEYILRPHKIIAGKEVIEKIVNNPSIVYCKVVKNTQRHEIQPILKLVVEKGSMLVSDEWSAYNGLNSEYDHYIVNHAAKEYVNNENPDIHSNTIEGFWTTVKRGIIGTYHKTSRKHLQRYANEFTFRYNTRHESETERLNHTIINAYGKRLPYKSLIQNTQL